MSTTEWQLGFPTGNWVATYRGFPIVIKRSDTDRSLEIGWFINGQVAESIPITCDLEWAKKLAEILSENRHLLSQPKNKGGY